MFRVSQSLPTPPPCGPATPPADALMERNSPSLGSPAEKAQPKAGRQMPSERAELMELGDEGEDRMTNVEISTRRILIDFHPSKPWEEPEKSAERVAVWKAQRKAALAVVNKIRNPSFMNQVSAMWKKYCCRTLPLRSLRDRSELDLRAACRFYFPPRSSIMAQIVDFSANRAVCYERPLGELEPYLTKKPDDVEVRWIHCPLGVGTLQSTIEEIFNYSGSAEVGRRFEHAGYPTWPYIDDFHFVAFYDRKWYEEQVTAWNTFSKADPLETGIMEDIDVLHGMQPKMRRDLIWRANHSRRKLDFWEMCKTDLPNLLTDRLIGDMSIRNRRLPKATTTTEQAIAEYKDFQSSLLLLSTFRSFHRSDGFLLTFNQQPGVDYMGPAFQDWLDRSNDVMKNADASVIAHCAQSFLSTGTSRWHRKTAEWFLVYLTCEVMAAPHPLRQGNGSTSLMNAYHSVALDMKEKQNLPWQRGESVRLVRKYLSSLDELRIILMVTKGKIHILEGLLQDVTLFEEQHKSAGDEESLEEDAEPMPDMVEWALGHLQSQAAETQTLIQHFQTALNELFQLRSIEQNELAIAADSQNKAILLFTAVTVIFLPLSFFTSYFGMNLRGIQDTLHNERYFWATCGVSAVILVTLLFVYGFRAEVLHRIRTAGGMQDPNRQPWSL